jgi:hypothetical protein
VRASRRRTSKITLSGPSYAHDRRVQQCLGTVLNEEWAHHGSCVRDLDKLTRREVS